MKSPIQLMFVRTIDCTVTYPISNCINMIQGFEPTLKAETAITIDKQAFVISYGERSQMKLWTIGTLEPLNETITIIHAQIGIARYQSNLKYVLGLSAVVWLMALSEGLIEELELYSLFIVAGLFFAGFWVLLIGAMAYSQHRFRHDLMKMLSPKQ